MGVCLGNGAVLHLSNLKARSREKPGSCEKVTLQRSPACCVCFEQVKPRCPHRLRPPARPFCSSFSTTCGKSAIIRGDDYAPDACRKRASGGVFSDYIAQRVTSHLLRRRRQIGLHFLSGHSRRHGHKPGRRTHRIHSVRPLFQRPLDHAPQFRPASPAGRLQRNALGNGTDVACECMGISTLG